MIGAVIICSLSVFSHITSSSECETTVTRVHDLLQVAYPELIGKDRFMTVSIGQPLDGSWRRLYEIRFEITPLPPDVSYDLPPLDPHTGKPVSPPSNTALLNGAVSFDVQGRISKMWADGPDITHSEKNTEIEQLIESHPGWSNAKDYEELKKAGALYGPADKDQFVQSVHLERFEKFFGDLKIKSVEFNGVTTEHEGSFGSMFWDIDAEAKLPGGGTCIYAFGFEPFGGRLVQIERVDRPPRSAPEPK